MSQEHFASFVACDDIRTEVSGKTLLIGMYGGNIIVPTLPAQIPKLVFLVKLRSSVDDPHRWMAVRIEIPGSEPSISERVEFGKDLPSVLKDPSIKYVETAHSVEFAPCELKEKGRIKVWVQSDKGEHYAGSVAIDTTEDAGLSAAWFNVMAVSLAFYSKVRKNSDRQLAQGLAAAIADFVADGIPDHVVKGMPDDQDCILEMAPKRFVVFFAHPRESVPKVTVLDLPEGAQAEISHVNQFGFAAKITPTDAAIKRLNFKVE